MDFVDPKPAFRAAPKFNIPTDIFYQCLHLPWSVCELLCLKSALDSSELNPNRLFAPVPAFILVWMFLTRTPLYVRVQLQKSISQQLFAAGASFCLFSRLLFVQSTAATTETTVRKVAWSTTPRHIQKEDQVRSNCLHTLCDSTHIGQIIRS